MLNIHSATVLSSF